jgi:hypothetical protein
MKRYNSLTITSILILIIWLGETLLRDWRGLEWLNYFHFSLIIIPTIFIAWLILIDKKFTPSKHLLKYPILIIGYFLFCFLVIAVLINNSESYNYFVVKPLAIFLFMVVTFGMNLIISGIESRKLRFKQKAILFFTCIFVPICSELITSLIFTQSWLFPQNIKLTSLIFHWLHIEGTSFSYFNEGIIHWLKSGGLIMSITLYEGIFILYLKKLMPIEQPK